MNGFFKETEMPKSYHSFCIIILDLRDDWCSMVCLSPLVLPLPHCLEEVSACPPADAAHQAGNDEFENGCEICAALMYLTIENVSVLGNLLPYLDPSPDNWMWI